MGSKSIGRQRDSFFSTLVVVWLSTADVVRQLVDAIADGLSRSWVVVGEWVVGSGLLGSPVLLGRGVLVVALAGLGLHIVVVLGLRLVLGCGWLVRLWVVLGLRLISRLRGCGLGCGRCLGDIVAFGLESVLSSSVPDHLLFARSVDVPVCARYGTVGIPGFLPEASVIAGVVSELVVSLQLCADVNVMHGGCGIVRVVAGLVLVLIVVVRLILGQASGCQAEDYDLLEKKTDSINSGGRQFHTLAQ